MKFSELKYKRPSIEEFKTEFNTVIDRMSSADSFEEYDNAFIAVYKLRDHFDTMSQLAEIRYNLDVTSEFYQKEMEYFNEVSPQAKDLVHSFYTVVTGSNFKPELEEKWGSHILHLADFAVRGFDSAIIDDLQQNNKLVTEYIQLKSKAKIKLEGKELNLGSIGKYLVDPDRSIRKKAHEGRWKFFADHQDQLDDIFDRMVKVRHRMARKMGFENFIELGYNWMGRMDYNEAMVDNFRKQVLEEIVPVCRKLRQRQQERLGYESLEDYDINYQFLSGNPKPKGNAQDIVAGAKTMYTELGSETEGFFNYLMKYDLMDLVSRPGKNDGGFCELISDYKHPFIFANFNGTAGDIRVLAHEGGHAFQFYASRNSELIEYRIPSSESAEIHAMSMELLTYPWMKDFFKEDTPKYLFSHFSERLLALPILCAGDHFQHIIYKNPDYTPKQRGDAWKEMQKLYMPDRKMNQTPYLEDGRYWQSIMHIYQVPFYMIDYGLAQICAFQFWQKANINREEAWKDYVRLCKAGGTRPFLQLVELAHLKSPFEDGTIKSITGDIENHLDSMDDSIF